VPGNGHQRGEMFGLKERWEDFKSGTPGERFQERYERQRENERGRFKRGLKIFFGLVILIAGIFFLPAPGPGMVILVIGAFMVAEQWAAAARGLDWLELRVRSLLNWLLRIWNASPLPVKALIVLVIAAGAAGLAYLMWQVTFGR
jgi:uncharacterized protein (TIGR02611 family)